jgi:hypothetical protein
MESSDEAATSRYPSIMGGNVVDVMSCSTTLRLG